MQLKKEDLVKAKQIKAFLDEHYREHYDYDYIAHKFGMNKFKLKLVFKAVTSANIHAYTTRLRITHAKELLNNTDENIENIANMVGLNKSNFNIQFKKLTGKTPSQWRKNPHSELRLSMLDTDGEVPQDS